MIFLLLDLFFALFSNIPMFCVLFSFLVFSKKQYFHFILVPLVLDLFIVHTYFFNTLVFTAIFFLVKHLKVTKVNIKNFLVLMVLIYLIYLFILGVATGHSYLYIFKFIVKYGLVHFLFYLLCYKLFLANIKLSR